MTADTPPKTADIAMSAYARGCSGLRRGGAICLSRLAGGSLMGPESLLVDALLAGALAALCSAAKAACSAAKAALEAWALRAASPPVMLLPPAARPLCCELEGGGLPGALGPALFAIGVAGSGGAGAAKKGSARSSIASGPGSSESPRMSGGSSGGRVAGCAPRVAEAARG
jgi:hypothetical protein